LRILSLSAYLFFSFALAYVADGGGYNPKQRSAPVQSSAPAQSSATAKSYTAPPLAAPTGVPMSSASKWEPCKLLSVACSLALLLCTVLCLSLGLVLALWQTHHSHLLARGRTLSHTLSVCDACPSIRTHSRTHVTDGGGYDPKRRSAPAQSAPAQSYTAPAQSYTTAPAAAPMASAPASKWEPCTF